MLQDQFISGSGGVSADGGGGEGNKHRRLGFDGNDTPQTHPDDVSTVAPFDVANDGWEDDSVAGGLGWDRVSARRTWSRQRIEGLERDKIGRIIRTCGVVGTSAIHANSKPSEQAP